MATRSSTHETFNMSARTYVEEGSAFIDAAAGGADVAANQPRTGRETSRRHKVVVIGAGQTGLSVGYHLAQRGIPCLILDANQRIGDTWRRRWDSLRLFTPRGYDSLDGLRFPAGKDPFPTKDEMADFLESYAAKFNLPVRTGVKVDGLTRRNGHYVVSAGPQQFEAEHVVVAMGTFQRAKVPAFAAELDPGIVQLHSKDYRNPAQLQDGGVLIVGAGNSGSEIARELAAQGRKVWMSGRDTGHVPFRIEGFLGRKLLIHLVIRLVFYHVLKTSSPLGRKVRPKVLAEGGPLIRVKPKDLAALGVERVSRTAVAADGKPRLADGRVLDVRNVIWCTGFQPDFSWIDLPVFAGEREPTHDRGIVAGEPGLYFIGLEFLYAMASAMVQGAGRDARHIVDRIASRLATAEADT